MKQRHCHAFTLIELLVVIMIIALLAGLLFPALIAARDLARRNRAKAEARQLVISWSAYWDTYKDWSFGNSFTMDDTKVGVLQGLDVSVNTNAVPFMEFPSKAEIRGFEDPWKQLYKVERDVGNIQRTQNFNVRVQLGNRDRYIYGD